MQKKLLTFVTMLITLFSLSALASGDGCPQGYHSVSKDYCCPFGMGYNRAYGECEAPPSGPVCPRGTVLWSDGSCADQYRSIDIQMKLDDVGV